MERNNAKFKNEESSLEVLSSSFADLEFKELLDKGGVGYVYLAYSSNLAMEVAVKILPRRYAMDADFCTMLNREEDLTSRLLHENLVRFYEYGVQAEYPYIIMEYVPGQTMHAMLKDGYMDPIDAAGYVKQVCYGLAFAHSQGVVHLDIKPANVMVTPEGVVKIIDFGLARGVKEYSYRGEKLWGSAGYTAPERVSRPKVLDYRSDIFSTGVMLCFLITGYIPTELVGYTYASAGVPESLAPVLAGAVEPVMEKRLSSILSFGEALRVYIKQNGKAKASKGIKGFLKSLVS